MTTQTRVRALTGALVAIVVGAAAYTAQSASAPERGKRARVERGKYLVIVGGCNDCHTPLKNGPNGPEWDMSRMLSGHPESFPFDHVARAESENSLMTAAATGTAFSGPWGVSYAFNLTPDQNTGTGIWTEEMFIQTLRTGKHMGVSREILPPMPWFNYGRMTDEDLKSVYAYLRTIPAISNHVPTPLPPPAPMELARAETTDTIQQ